MDFYQSISKYYHHIFPLNKFQLDFIDSAHSNKNEDLKVLDIGCAIGDLSIALAESYKQIVGIDLDEGMLHKAAQKSSNIPNLKFQLENMLHIDQTFGSDSFDIIACFGNTLVHLDSEDSILEFFRKSKLVLRPKGKLLFQIINYDRIIDKNINFLPTIENEVIKFERNYQYHPTLNRIDFETILTIKENSERIQNNIPLLPVRKSAIYRLLNEADFNEIQYYGNFKRDELTDDSMPLVVEAGI